MFRRFHYAIVQAAIVLVAVAGVCMFPRPHASPPNPIPKVTTPEVKAEVRQVAKQERASFVTELTFKPRSFDLTPEAQHQLADALKRANGVGKIDKIQLIVWADHEYPSQNRKHLSADEIRLADRRAKAVNDFLKERSPDAATDAYNMAERPNALQKILVTDDARIKRSLEAAGIPTTAKDLETPQYASKTLVLVLLKD